MREELATQLTQASSARPGKLGCFLQKALPSGEFPGRPKWV